MCVCGRLVAPAIGVPSVGCKSFRSHSLPTCSSDMCARVFIVIINCDLPLIHIFCCCAFDLVKNSSCETSLT
eukprot:m.375563 g.375563  ORF g.375563 m.375563 type:complete len:72 (+) comp77579_c0_seq1:119-334(+)